MMYNINDRKPVVNKNCVCVLVDGKKTACRYNARKAAFYGRYGALENEILQVEKWEPAILEGGLPDMVENSLLQIGTLQNGADVFAMEFSKLSEGEQENLFDSFSYLAYKIFRKLGYRPDVAYNKLLKLRAEN